MLRMPVWLPALLVALAWEYNKGLDTSSRPSSVGLKERQQVQGTPVCLLLVSLLLPSVAVVLCVVLLQCVSQPE